MLSNLDSQIKPAGQAGRADGHPRHARRIQPPWDSLPPPHMATRAPGSVIIIAGLPPIFYYQPGYVPKR